MDRTTYINQHHARFGIAEPQVVAVVEEATGRKATATRRVVRGDEYEVHRVQHADDSATYLRVAWPGEPEQKTRDEAAAMTRARDAGVAVPEVLALRSIDSADGDRLAMVVAEAPGRQLGSVAAQLSIEQRAAVMTGIGRTLQTLHSIAMPGAGLPDDHGRWQDPAAKRQGYIANVLDDSRHLAAAGLTAAEVARVRQIVRAPIVPLENPAVLCHGDLSSEHVFIDSDLRVVGLIDWGQWYAGSTASDLSGLAMIYPKTDLDAIIAGHGFLLDKEIDDQLRWHTITQATGEIRWLVVSGQREELDRPRTALLTALSMINF